MPTFKEEVETTERCGFTSISRPNERSNEPKKGRGPSLQTAATLVSSTTGSNQSSPTYTFRGNLHPSVNCPVAVDCTYTVEHLEKEGKLLCVPEGTALEQILSVKAEM